VLVEYSSLVPEAWTVAFSHHVHEKARATCARNSPPPSRTTRVGGAGASLGLDIHGFARLLRENAIFAGVTRHSTLRRAGVAGFNMNRSMRDRGMFPPIRGMSASFVPSRQTVQRVLLSVYDAILRRSVGGEPAKFPGAKGVPLADIATPFSSRGTTVLWKPRSRTISLALEMPSRSSTPLSLSKHWSGAHFPAVEPLVRRQHTVNLLNAEGAGRQRASGAA